jgi:hypothetical protein
MKRLRWSGLFLLMALLSSLAAPAAAQIQVASATPNSTTQGTINLNVTVGGKGFKKGAKAAWFVTGTTNPGGVTVNSTAFVNSTTLVANITVADAATVSSYDVQVQNSDGRIGSGTELFAVQSSSPNPNCTAQSLPAGINLIGTLNYVNASGAAAYSPALGKTLRAVPMTLGSRNVTVLAASNSNASPATLEVFFLDPVTGQVLDRTNIGSTTAVQPHITISYSAGSPMTLAVGDANGDGIPDFGTTNGPPTVFVGAVTNGILSYAAHSLQLPASAGGVTWGIAMGDLNGDGKDEVAVGSIGGGNTLGEVSLYSFDGTSFTNYANIQSPLPNPKKDERFGQGIAIADVTGDSRLDLIVSANGSTVNGNTNAGRVFVFPGPVSASTYLTFTTGIKNDSFGYRIAAGNVNGDSFGDFLASTDWNGSDPRANIYTGLVSSGQAANFTLRPLSGAAGEWGTNEPRVGDVNGDGLDDVIVSAPNSSTGTSCTSGTAYLYLSNPAGPTPLATQLAIQLASPTSYDFGWAVGFAKGSRLFFVTNPAENVGSVSGAGQIYVYQVN